MRTLTQKARGLDRERALLRLNQARIKAPSLGSLVRIGDAVVDRSEFAEGRLRRRSAQEGAGTVALEDGAKSPGDSS